MCCNQQKEHCQKPERLHSSPRECSPEQVRKCHGEGAGHPCTGKPPAK